MVANTTEMSQALPKTRRICLRIFEVNSKGLLGKIPPNRRLVLIKSPLQDVKGIPCALFPWRWVFMHLRAFSFCRCSFALHFLRWYSYVRFFPGNLCSLGGTLFLMGPVRQIQRMFDPVCPTFPERHVRQINISRMDWTAFFSTRIAGFVGDHRRV